MESKVGQKGATSSPNDGSPSTSGHRGHKWRNTNSKFNRILNNLERSILNQFGGGGYQHATVLPSTDKTVSDNNVANKSQLKFHSQSSLAKPRTNATKGRAPSAPPTQVVASRRNTQPPSNASDSKQQQHQKADTKTQQHSFPNKITSISSPINIGGTSRDNVTTIKERIEQQANSGKMTLNKCQQQIVSTLRPSQQAIVGAKLSIPPPHANDEARSISQRVLFGATIVDQQTTSAQQAPQRTQVQQVAPKRSSGLINRRSEAIVSREEAPRLNSSPASSAQSLPPSLAGGQKLGSQIANDTGSAVRDRDAEESGFATYQSRRSLVSEGDKLAPNSSNSPEQLNSTTMFQYHNHNRVPIGHALQYCGHNSNNTNQQQYLYNYSQNLQLNQSPINNHQKPAFMQLNQQQQIQPNAVSNRVPISNDKSPVISVKQHYQMQPNQQPQTFNDLHQFYGLYPNNGIDGNSQICTNAPPKPRRYQYYDATQRVPMLNAFNRPPTSYNNGMMYVTPLQYANPVTGVQDLGMPATSRSHHMMIPNHLNNSLAYSNQMNYDHNNFLIQQRMSHPPPYTLTKSKSSLDASDLIRSKSTAEPQPPQQQAIMQRQASHTNPAHQQPIYGSRFDTIGRQAGLLFKDQQGSQTQQQPLQGNLQRSKSVNHLVPVYGLPQLKSNGPIGQQDIFVDQKQHTFSQQAKSRFLSVSSASTTHLNLLGSGSHHQGQQQPHTLMQRAPSIHNLNFSASGRAPSTSSYNGSCQSQQQFMGQQAALAAAISRQQQSQRLGYNRHSSQMAPNDSKDQRRLVNNNGTTDTDGSSMFSNNGPPTSNKLIRQSLSNTSFVQEADSFNKPSLDDKIRYLMIDRDDAVSDPASRGSVIEHQNTVYQQSLGNNSNVTNEHASTKAATAAWNVRSQRQKCMPEQQSLALANHNSTSAATPSSRQEKSTQDDGAFVNYDNEFDLKNIVFVDSTDMGNRQHRQYQFAPKSKQQQFSDTNNSPKDAHNNAHRSVRGSVKNDASSHLIVDLTTPRVLAKTETTLLSMTSGSHMPNPRESWSINQVGLPQLQSPGQSKSKASSSPHDNSPSEIGGVVKSIINQHYQKSCIDSRDPTSSVDNMNPGDELKRSAPYYYSDLKSAEQRQALLNIVQQKSLSPPPQLLSRSANLSNTRLAPRSATMHSNQAKQLSENLGNRQRPTRGSMQDSSSRSRGSHPANSDFSSTSNISRNIDRLFDDSSSNNLATRANTVQSVLTLNDLEKIPDLRQAFPPPKSLEKSTLRNNSTNENLSKSKSLENICQKSDAARKNAAVAIEGKTSNPVYENIRRSDKLLSAINSSTTCLSTSSSRAALASKKNILKNRQVSVASASDESMDSILGSSLEDSDSYSDIIDDVKLTPSDNHLADMGQLIDRLKANHAKLTEEYKTTLQKIRETVGSRSKQSDGSEQSRKLSKRLQLLELKSKKCESRSRNQLHLIQMMEKVLKQSKSERSGVARPQPIFIGTQFDGSSIDSGSASAKLSSQNLSADYRRGASGGSTSSQDPSPKSTASSCSSAKDSISQKSISSLNQSPVSQKIIKAVVTEVKNPGEFKFANDIMKKRAMKADESTKDIGKPNDTKTDSSASKNPFTDENHNDSDDSKCSLNSSLTTEAYKLLHSSETDINTDPSQAQKQLVNEENCFDEDDFIEFLSTDGSLHRSSQFEASQFSASDFNNSTSTSESSTSGAGNDSLNSPVMARARNRYNYRKESGSKTANGASKTKGDSPDMQNSSEKNVNNSEAGDNNNADDEKDHEMEVKSLFNDILGNVVDVDVCPRNNLSECSPVNS